MNRIITRLIHLIFNGFENSMSGYNPDYSRFRLNHLKVGANILIDSIFPIWILANPDFLIYCRSNNKGM